MELHGKIALIKYVCRIVDISIGEAKEIVDAFYTFYNADSQNTWRELEIIRLSLFVGKIRSGEWVLRGGRVTQEKLISLVDVEDLTKF